MVPVEVRIPPAQLALMDTSAAAVRARQAAAQPPLDAMWGPAPSAPPAAAPGAAGLPW
jgi:hypothetical protein